VFVDAAPWPGLANWCVQLFGPVSGSVTTDASGVYLFSGLPEGTYTVCEVLQSGWHETFPADGPACTGGFGYSMFLSAGSGATFNDFYNLSP
jgi:hypothetical protein